MVAMKLVDVRRRKSGGDAESRHFVLLAEVDGPRRLAIWIGEHEATALAVQLEGTALPRPMTYALTAELLKAAGGTVREVRIDRLEGDVFYAVVVINGMSSERELDARPSDALNLALLFAAPIQVASDLLDRTGEWMAQEWWSRLDEVTEGPAAITAFTLATWS